MKKLFTALLAVFLTFSCFAKAPVAYSYDDKGYFKSEITAAIDPLESEKAGKDIYFLPADATYEKPLDAKDGFKIKFVDGAWQYEEIIPEPEPEEYKPSEKELLQTELFETEKELADSDYKIVKSYEYILVGKPLPYDMQALHEERQALRDKINALQTKINELE